MSTSRIASPYFARRGIEGDFNLPALLEQFGPRFVPLAEQISTHVALGEPRSAAVAKALHLARVASRESVVDALLIGRPDRSGNFRPRPAEGRKTHVAGAAGFLIGHGGTNCTGEKAIGLSIRLSKVCASAEMAVLGGTMLLVPSPIRMCSDSAGLRI